MRDEAKFDRIVEFGKIAAEGAPDHTRAICASAGLGRRRVLATVAHLLDTTLVRVGNREYARDNKSYGLTTLQDRHVTFTGSELRFQFRGKTGKEWRLKLSDRRVARIVRSCQELPGQHLFQYEDGDGVIRQVTSTDVNDYIRNDRRRRGDGEGFPHLGRHGARRHGAARIRAGLELTASAKRNIREAMKTRRRAARQHTRLFAANVTYIQRCSPLTSMASWHSCCAGAGKGAEARVCRPSSGGSGDAAASARAWVATLRPLTALLTAMNAFAELVRYSRIGPAASRQ